MAQRGNPNRLLLQFFVISLAVIVGLFSMYDSTQAKDDDDDSVIVDEDDQYVDEDDEEETIETEDQDKYTRTVKGCPEYSHEVMLDGFTFMENQRSYYSYFNLSYFCTSYMMRFNFYYKSGGLRNRYNEPYNYRDYTGYWGKLYKTLYLQDSPLLTNFKDSLQTIAIRDSLNYEQFAHLIVNFVQDIPYSYVLDETPCGSEHKESPCVTQIKFGLFTPVEFLYHLNEPCFFLLYCMILATTP